MAVYANDLGKELANALGVPTSLNITSLEIYCVMNDVVRVQVEFLSTATGFANVKEVLQKYEIAQVLNEELDDNNDVIAQTYALQEKVDNA